MPKNLLKIALIQNKILFGDPLRTSQTLKRLVTKALKKRPHLILLPEIFLGGTQIPKQRKNFAKIYQDFLKFLKVFTKTNKVFFFGSILEKSEKKIFNTAILVSDTGKILNTYRKNYLFRLEGEHKIYSPGKKSRLWNSPWGKIAPLICYDIRFPELLRKLTLKGARSALVCAQWPKPRREHWLTLLKARAIENQMFVIACNARGQKGNLDFVGDSCVISPWGEILFQMNSKQDVGYFEIDLSLTEKIRKTYPFLRDAIKA